MTVDLIHWGSGRLMPKTPNKTTTKTDKLVGRNIRIHRLSKGLTLAKLGAMSGVTLMQIQKYEAGVDRVSSGRLYKIAQLLEAPPIAFFKGARIEPAGDASSFEFLDDPMCLQMLRQFSKLRGVNKRRLVMALVEQLVRERKQ